MKYLALATILLFFAAFICAPAAADVIVIFTDDDVKPTPTPTPTKEIYYYYDEELLMKAQYVVDWYEPILSSGNIDDVGKMQYESAKTIVNNQGVVGGPGGVDLDAFFVKGAYRFLTETPKPTSSPMHLIGLIVALAAAAIIINRR